MGAGGSSCKNIIVHDLSNLDTLVYVEVRNQLFLRPDRAIKV
jgi:hypothetical protein